MEKDMASRPKPPAADRIRMVQTAKAVRRLLVLADPGFYAATIEGLRRAKQGQSIRLEELRNKYGLRRV
jgi:hypothetical protein